MDFTSAISMFNSVYDLIDKFQGKVKDAKLQRALAEVLAQFNHALGQLSALQLEAATLRQENERLRKENKEIKQRVEGEANYVLKQLGTGGLVYAQHKQDAPQDGDGSPSHYLCANCYADGRKSILQFSRDDYDGRHYVCPSCGAEVIDTDNRLKMEILSSSSPLKAKLDRY